MTNKIIYGRTQTKIDTAENWQDSSEPLLEGELAIDKTNNELRYGDGVNAFQNSKILGMSAAEREKLNGVSEHANNITFSYDTTAQKLSIKTNSGGE